ncbi:MAG: hypothetical protein M1837_007196 [Sclerophora amabilis]|nr:MAG: hypothetical protein M1837_007196 [Sclerophora amabilis]
MVFCPVDVRTGIQIALTESRSVVCFVRNDTEESQRWEHDLEEDESIAAPLRDKAVLLRIQAGSQEAAWLSSFCAVEQVPSLIVIENGQPRELLAPGLSMDESKALLLAALKDTKPSPAPQQTMGTKTKSQEDTGSASSVPPASTPSTAASSSTATPSAASSSTELAGSPSATPAFTPINESSSSTAASSSTELAGPPSTTTASDQPRSASSAEPAHPTSFTNTVSSQPRSARAESKRPATEDAPSLTDSQSPTTPANSTKPTQTPSSTNNTSHQPLSARAASKRPITEPAPSPTDPQSSTPTAASSEAPSTTTNTATATATQTYAQQQRKRVQDARSERERILRLVEADKAQRRQKAETQRRLHQEAISSQNPTPDSDTKPLFSIGASSCALQVRLLTGTTLRNHFPDPHESTLRSAVRPWIDSSRTDGDEPYTFKEIKSPLPNRAIEITEEDQSLAELGLTPNATLVMVPVARAGKVAAAYDRSLAREPWGRWAFGVLIRTVAGVLGSVANLVGLGEPPESFASNSAGAATTDGSSTGVKIRTLHDAPPETETERAAREAKGLSRDRQFYNGNQLNFEPRKDKKHGPGGSADDEGSQ